MFQQLTFYVEDVLPLWCYIMPSFVLTSQDFRTKRWSEVSDYSGILFQTIFSKNMREKHIFTGVCFRGFSKMLHGIVKYKIQNE